MGKTPIEWTEETWNPVRGCSPVSPGCKRCYAERTAGRFCKEGEPFHGFVQIGKNGDPGPHWTGKVELIPEMLEIPLRRKKPTSYFVNSMSDLFHENLNPADRWKVFDSMRRAPWHTYQILTKREFIMRAFMWDWERLVGPPPANWWLGVSVEDRARKERIDELRETPAAIRFLSLEPLLEDLGTLDLRSIDWVIVGGESGPGARPMHPDWVRSIRDQCVAAGVAFFFKQWGEWQPLSRVDGVQELPFGEYSSGGYGKSQFGFLKRGKKRAGRLLDGREWNEMPAGEERNPCLT